MRTTILVIAVLLVCAATATAQDVTGNWQGTLHAGAADLRLVLHITRAEDGSLHATLDSVDQGANGIPVKTVALQDSVLKLDVAAVHGTYEGTVNKGATEITGTWSQGQPLTLNFKRAAAPISSEHKAAPPSDIDGGWLGTLDTGAFKLRIVFHIVNTADGLAGTMDSPDQNTKGIPLGSVTRKDSSLKIEIKSIGGGFEGTISQDRNTIDGTWTQLGRSSPLVLTRMKGDSVPEPRRPQNPTKPYPYREEDVSYENKEQLGVTLAATLTIPEGKGPFPAVLLICGSGPHDRDESLLGHKPFLVLSDYLTRHGILVLRADKRGTAKSTGDYKTATTADFATDAAAGLAYLRTRPEVNPKKIGLIGHSEGGAIAPLVAAQHPEVAFVVLMAGPGVRGDEILVAQGALIEAALGKSQEEVSKDSASERKLLDIVETEKDDATRDKKMREEMAGKVPDTQIDAAITQLTSPWFRYFLSYDPAPTLRSLKCPVLAINGEKDLQVPPKQNLPAIRKALETGHNKHFEIVEMPGLNHLFQTAKTGAPSEYASIEETMSPAAMQTISDWVLKQ
ncbi:MAG TPA: alpha/beta fold hydrolase [Candidatus Nitrosotalea sp.]|nr:alpha/beta fold hydrolase [Candidatus Nitrosotalea sp.]